LEDVTQEELNEQYQTIIAEAWKNLAAARAWTKRLEAELFITRRALDAAGQQRQQQRHTHVELSAPHEPAGPSPAEQALYEDKDKTTVSEGHWPNLKAAGFDDFS
jgi:glycine cleavage system aminomethyltransferase T